MACRFEIVEDTEFLSTIETNRRNGKIHPQIEEIKKLSADYQECLLQYPNINKELL